MQCFSIITCEKLIQQYKFTHSFVFHSNLALRWKPLTKTALAPKWAIFLWIIFLFSMDIDSNKNWLNYNFLICMLCGNNIAHFAVLMTVSRQRQYKQVRKNSSRSQMPIIFLVFFVKKSCFSEKQDRKIEKLIELKKYFCQF